MGRRAAGVGFCGLKNGCQGNMFVKAGSGPSSHCLYGIGIRDPTYPERLAYQCLHEVMERVHMTQGDSLHQLSSLALSEPLKKPIRDIMKKFQLADRDRTYEVQGKVDELKENMSDNVRRILETHHNWRIWRIGQRICRDRRTNF